MKQLCLELWIENKQFPVLLILKIIIVFTALFSCVLIKGCPCGFAVVFFVKGLLLVTAFFNPQIEYLLPRTDEERRKGIIQKSIVISGFYTAAGMAGYALAVCFYEQYDWDAELLFFMILFSIYTFTNIFCCYIGLWQRKNTAVSNESFQKELIHMGFFQWLKIASVVLADISILFFCFYKFVRWEAFLFFEKDRWRTTAFLVMSIAAVVLCIAAWKDSKKIEITDYCG